MSLHPRSWDLPVGVVDTAPNSHDTELPPYAIEYADGSFETYGRGTPQFKIVVANRAHFERLFGLDAYSLAMKFVRGEFSIEGDLLAAFRFYRTRSHSPMWNGVLAAIAKLGLDRFEGWFQSRNRAAQNIRFHYDQSNEFYAQFLDSRMVYSCAYFHHPDECLEDAQLRKIEQICRKLNFKPGESFLDVGCGWGGLITQAAEEYGTLSTGCTLSLEQFKFASRRVVDRGLASKVRIELSDYRDIQGPFDKIASIGMFEHVGRRRMKKYLATLNRLVRPGGLVLNQGVTRPETVSDDAETFFVRRQVFPGGEIPSLSGLLRSAECAGFEVLDVENARPHYALTCRAWFERLQKNATQCLRYVDRAVYRTWLLAFAASAVCFEQGSLNLTQALLYKPGPAATRPFTREYMYGLTANSGERPQR